MAVMFISLFKGFSMTLSVRHLASMALFCLPLISMAQHGSAPVAVLPGAPTKSLSHTPSAALPAPPALVAPSFQFTNLFDKDRKVWPDRVPPPAPPPPPPAPAAVTEQDMQLYGVVITNEKKRATVRVGQRFAHLAPAGRSFANLVEGQSLGDFTLSAIYPDHLVLLAQGGEQRLYFTRKTDRGAHPIAQVAAVPPPVQDVTHNPTPEATGANMGAPAMAQAAAQAQGLAPTTSSATGTIPVASGTAAHQAGQNDTSSGTAAPFNLRNSLATALEAARNNQPRPPGGASGTTNVPFNPFQKP